MNVHHEPAHRHASTDGESHLDGRLDDRNVVSTSTRVILDGCPHRCESCDGVIDVQDRYKCVTVRDRDGRTSELDFCDEDCLAVRRRNEPNLISGT